MKTKSENQLCALAALSVPRHAACSVCASCTCARLFMNVCVRKDMGHKYDNFKSSIEAYIAALKDKGDTDLAEITQQLLDFRNTHEAEWLAWFDRIREIFAENPSGHSSLRSMPPFPG